MFPLVKTLAVVLFAELNQLELILQQAPKLVQPQLLGKVQLKAQQLPVYAIEIGEHAKDKPVLLLTGGVHGLERIGTQVLLAYLESLCARLQWDQHFAALFDKVQLCMVPLLNPGGMALGWRSNPQHIDLMRNAPTEALEKAAFLLGGHRVSRFLPWYRGAPGELAQENQWLIAYVRQFFQAPFMLALDCHSGFGRTDRLWFPYAKTAQQPIAHLSQMYRLQQLLFQSFPQQNYIFEPQSRHYLCHGDLWDHLYDESQQYQQVFLPLTLEMGSWNWVRKNPFQLLKSHGLFHPVKPHRVKRVLRSHLILLDFLLHATAAAPDWLGSVGDEQQQAAKALWYSNT